MTQVASFFVIKEKAEYQVLVRMKGLEPSRLAALAPKASVSTNSTTSAQKLAIQLLACCQLIETV